MKTNPGWCLTSRRFGLCLQLGLFSQRTGPTRWVDPRLASDAFIPQANLPHPPTPPPRRNPVQMSTPAASVRTKLQVIVKRFLRKYWYPLDKQQRETQTVLEQAELLCGWV